MRNYEVTTFGRADRESWDTDLGHMTRWSNGRGSISFGGRHLWGSWTDDLLVLNDGLGDYGYNEHGLRRDQ